MAERSEYDACMSCKVLFRRGTQRCDRCFGPLQEAPDHIVQAKKRARARRKSERNSQRRRTSRSTPPTTPPELPSVPRKAGPGATLKVDLQTIGRHGPDSKNLLESSGSLPIIRPTDSAVLTSAEQSAETAPSANRAKPSDLLSELESAPIPTSPRRRTSARLPAPPEPILPPSGPAPDGRNSLFIPLESFSDERPRNNPRQANAEATQKEGSTRDELFARPPSKLETNTAGLFGDSATVGASGITANTQAARRDGGALAEPVPFGDYVLREVLGRGGMGVVYKALQRSLNREVALKVMSGQTIAEEDRLRFLREARAAARLRHPNIVPIFDIDNYNGHDFFTLEFINGSNLHKLALDRALDLDDSLEILRKVALAIAYAHEQGVIHRDLKPQNILLDLHGEPHVTDFGLAKDLQDTVDLTHAGIALGSPPYMPPEQAMGNYENVDAVSDVYGLGAILYELLTGRPPFTGETPYEVLARVQSEDPIPPTSIDPNIPKDVEVICLKALEKVRRSRYQTAQELAEDIERFQRGDPIIAQAPSFTMRLARRLVKHRTVTTILSLALIAFCTVVFAAVRNATGYQKVLLEFQSPPPKPLEPDRELAPIDAALLEASRGSWDSALSTLCQTFPPELNNRRSLLSEARSELASSTSNELGDVLRLLEGGDTDLFSTRSLFEQIDFQCKQARVEQQRFEKYLSGLNDFFAVLIRRSYPSDGGSIIDLFDRIRASPQLTSSPRVPRRVADARLAVRLYLTIARLRQASELNFIEARVRFHDALRSAPDFARLELALGVWTQLSNASDKQSWIESLSRMDSELAEKIAQPPARPRLDNGSGRLVGTGPQAWSFPLFTLQSSTEQPAQAVPELLKAQRLAWPTAPVLYDGHSVLVGWLGMVLRLNLEDGQVLDRIALPARVIAIRRTENGNLIVTCDHCGSYQSRTTQSRTTSSTSKPEGSPPDLNKNNDGSGTTDYLITFSQPRDNPIHGIFPEQPGAEPTPLSPVARIPCDPLVAFQLYYEADSALEYNATLDAIRQLKELDDSKSNPKPRDKPPSPASIEYWKRLRNELPQRIERSKALGPQPWLSVLTARLARSQRNTDELAARSQEAAAAVLSTRGRLIDPFDELRLAAEIAALGSLPLAERHFQSAARDLFVHCGYEPRYAGSGPLDPSARISQLMLELIEVASARTRSDDQNFRRELARRYACLEAWRDSLAPALASLGSQRRDVERIMGVLPAREARPLPLREGAPERMSGGFLGLSLSRVFLFEWAFRSLSLAMTIVITILATIIPLARARRAQHRELASLNFSTPWTRLSAWWRDFFLRFEHWLPFYTTPRERLAFTLSLLVFFAANAYVDSTLLLFSARERAPAMLLAGLPGHPQSLHALITLVEERGGPAGVELATEVSEHLAFGLACVGEHKLASELYSVLAPSPKGRHAFNAALLEGFDRRADSKSRQSLVERLESLISNDYPERAWARYLFLRERAAFEAAVKLSEHRFSLIDHLAGPETGPILVAPTRHHRDQVIAGVSSHFELWLERVPRLLWSDLDLLRLPYLASELTDPQRRSPIFLSLNLRNAFLYTSFPALLLLSLASLIWVVRRPDPLLVEERPWWRCPENLLPGLPALQRGAPLYGMLLIIFFTAISNRAFVAFTKPVDRRVLSLDRIRDLSGNFTLAEHFIAFKESQYLVLSLALIFFAHSLLLWQLRRQERHRGELLHSNRGRTTNQPFVLAADNQPS